MSNTNDWHTASIREKLADEFPGAWGNSPDGGRGNALALRSTNIDDVGNIEYRTGAERVLPESKLEGKALQTGDIILEGSGGGNGKPVGRVALFEHPRDGRTYVCSNFFRTLRPSSQVDNRFLFWRLLHYWRQPSIWAHQQQTTSIINLKHKHYLATEFEWPPLPEQRRIADVLDTVDAAIRETDDVIAKQEQVKTGLLQDLLTHGLDADGRLRDPEANPEAFRDTELGTLPSDWQLFRFEDIIAEGPQNGLYKPKSAYADEDRGYPIVRIDSFYEGRITKIGDLRRLDLTPSERRTYGLEAGDILINRVNSRGFIGKNAIVPELDEPTVFESNVMRLKVDQNVILPEFLNGLMNTPIVLRQLQVKAKDAVAQSSINQQDVGECLIPTPDLPEQRRIIERLSVQNERFHGELAYQDKLQRLKTGLMQDLLTGRVRVPEAEERVEDVVS